MKKVSLLRRGCIAVPATGAVDVVSCEKVAEMELKCLAYWQGNARLPGTPAAASAAASASAGCQKLPRERHIAAVS